MLSGIDLLQSFSHEELLVRLLIVYMAGLFIIPAFPKGRVRNLIGKFYAPMVYLGLWYRWSMYAPEAPTSTRIALPGAVRADGTFEPLLPELDAPGRFGRARGLRMIAFQWALCGAGTDYLKPSLCDFARRRRPGRKVSDGNADEPVAFEVRSYEYPSPAPGSPETEIAPSVNTLYTTADANR